MITLPTLLVVLVLLNGEVYQNIESVPSMEVCQDIVKNIKNVLPKAVGGIPEMYSATCVTLKPFTRDA